jgi:hypothetical protein
VKSTLNSWRQRYSADIIWSLEWELGGVFHRHEDDRADVTAVVDILDMWSFLEAAYDNLSSVDKGRLDEEADLFGSPLRFAGL